MSYILDTDHISLYQHGYIPLLQKLKKSNYLSPLLV
jgi:hypothetical protein